MSDSEEIEGGHVMKEPEFKNLENKVLQRSGK